MVAKASLGLIGISAISIGGVAVTKPWLLGMDYMPEWHSLSEDNGFSEESNGYKGKYGEKYGKYLVGVTNKRTADREKHESWWEWSYRRWKKDKGKPEKGKFSKIELGYGADASKHLSQICKDAYGKADGDFQTKSDTSDSKFKKDEVWKYCSVGQKQPQTITEFNADKTSDKEEYTGKIGSDASKQSQLLSIKSPNNDWVWELKDKEFGNTNIDATSYFQTKQKGPNRKTIKEICEEAYGSPEKTDNGKDKLTKDDTVKYCSL